MKPLERLKIMVARTQLSSRKIGEDEEHPLQALIELKVRQELRHDKDFRRSLGRSRITDVSRQDLVEYQLHKFRKQMRYVGENSIFYQNLFKEKGLSPKQIVTYEDLLKVPVTEPADLANEPFHFLCVSQGEVLRAFTTTGTSGQRKKLFYTQHDVLNIVDSIASALRNTSMNGDDTLHIMFPAVSAWDPSLMLDGACKVAGLRSNVCSEIDVEAQLKAMRDAKAKVIIGLTSFIYRITVLARDKNDLRSMGIKAIICSSEPLSEAVRREIESAWGCKALTQYGLTEMGLATAVECFAQDGLHIDEGNYLCECIDPATGLHQPDRKEGELIWSSLNMKGSPLLRYRSYDLSWYSPPPCGCGYATVGKMGKPKGRINGETKIGLGDKVWPSLFDEAVLSVLGVLGYQVIIDKSAFRDRLTFNVEYHGDASGAHAALMDKLLALDEIKAGIDNDLLETPIIVIVPERKEFILKQKTIVDNRPLFDVR